MIVGKRIQERLGVVGFSQAELARRVPMSQSAMNTLIAGKSRSSTRLHTIARILGTTPAYLSGETDDPDTGAPPPEPAAAHLAQVWMPVTLPAEAALARMFKALLMGIGSDVDEDERALLLAQRLPIGLAQLQDLRPMARAGRKRGEVASDTPSMPHLEPTR